MCVFILGLVAVIIALFRLLEENRAWLLPA